MLALTGDTPATIYDAGTRAVVSDSGFIRDGYRFTGWNTQSDGTGQTYFPADEIPIEDEDLTLYAQWEKIFTVTFMDEDGTIYAIDDAIPLGGNSTPPPTPTKTGYTFAGWIGNYTDIKQDENVVASWTPNRYTIVYDPNGGDGIHMLDQEMLYDKKGRIFENEYVRSNYEFVGWNTLPDGTGASYAPEETFANLTDVPNGKVYLYAQWKFYIQMPNTGTHNLAIIMLLSTVLIAAGCLGISSKKNM